MSSPIEQKEPLIDKKEALKIKRREYMRRYRDLHPEVLVETRRRHYEKVKETNPDYYRKANREAYNRQKEIRYECPCYSRFSKPNLRTHLKSMQHKLFAKRNPHIKYPWETEDDKKPE